jgi:hypothetical protein
MPPQPPQPPQMPRHPSWGPAAFQFTVVNQGGQYQPMTSPRGQSAMPISPPKGGPMIAIAQMGDPQMGGRRASVSPCGKENFPCVINDNAGSSHSRLNEPGCRHVCMPFRFDACVMHAARLLCVSVDDKRKVLMLWGPCPCESPWIRVCFSDFSVCCTCIMYLAAEIQDMV